MGVLLSAALTACGQVDGAARSIKDAASPSPSSGGPTTAPPSKSASPSPTKTTRKPTTSRPPTSASPTRGPVTSAEVPNLSVGELISLARTAARTVKTVHVRATIKLDGTKKMLIDVYVDRETENFTGSASTDKYVLQIVRKGDAVWFKGDEQYWVVEGKGQFSAADAKTLATKWFRTSDTDSSVSGIVTGVLGASNPEYVLEHLNSSSTKLPLQQFEGWTVIPISASTGTGYLNAALPVYPIRLITNGPEPEADNYDKFNEPVNIAEPPASEVVDLPKS
ncbi:hypothetical protein [Streptodolium elevatio]|uniref:Lipoprotein n=1 Tax=Streptodolium elevatio TaxID=3157996 RepID=A0ABV3DKX8_9ACTN